MEDVRQLVQEEGREARNLVAFHVAVDSPARPPRKPSHLARAGGGRPGGGRTARRSASAGRDKHSELRARYWALLFGDLQRAIGEIYNTVEVRENMNECQEVILVLENYTRDFKALGEWFRLKWEYDNTPPPQRPQSLTWEIRKTDFVRPESRRAYSVKSSPTVSGKNSPCLSGHNTPSGKHSPVTGKASPGSGKISPRIPHPITSPKGNLEFFSAKIVAKTTAKPEPKLVKENRLSEIKEKDVKGSLEDVKEPEVTKVAVVSDKAAKVNVKRQPVVEVGKVKECPSVCPKQVVIKSPERAKQSNDTEISSQAKATINKLDEMENEFLAKQLLENKVKDENTLNQDKEIEQAIESEELSPEKTELTNSSSEARDITLSASPEKSEDNFGDVSNESSPVNPKEEEENSPLSSIDNDESSESVEENLNFVTVVETIEEKHTPKEIPDKISEEITSKEINNSPENSTNNAKENVHVTSKEEDKKVTKQPDEKRDDSKKTECKTVDAKPSSRPAYSQAAAKPKPITSKSEVKAPIKSTTTVARSKNVVEMPNSASKTRQFAKRNQTSKCSYPFNLTTGRTTLFDASTPVVKSVVKKVTPSNKTQVGAGDAKAVPAKVDPKRRPPRPTSLKINEKGDKKDKANPTLEKIKDCDEYSSSDTIVTQIDMSRIESSESLKTLVPEDLQMMQDVANSIEVLNIDSNKNDNEGWLTVKSRRLSRESKKQSKSHWANRFNQPSATTSLPTLNIISPKQESNPVVDEDIKLDRAQSEQPEKRKPEKGKVFTKPKAVSKVKDKDPAMIRQKSDVTGLKTHSARNKVAKRSEKLQDLPQNDGELTKNRLHSSLESLTTALARSQESTEEVFDFDKWKAEFTSTFKYLDEEDHLPNHNEILKTADPTEMSEIAEMTSQIEESERKLCLALDFQTDVDQRKLCEEEDSLNRQIMELQQGSDNDLDTETDDTETDAEILCEDSSMAIQPAETLGALAASLEDQYETALAGMSWAERVDTLVVLEALVARDPGRAQQLHAKLSQGIKRRGSFQDALRRLQAKQARAERQRHELATERAKKIHTLLARVEEVKVAKNQLIEEKRLRMERRLQRAAENRDQHLKDIVRKAHDEEEKLREIAFIKQLEEQNRRHEFLDQCRATTTRLRQMRRERMGKLELKAAREAAVGARRLALLEARARHVAALVERRRQRDARADRFKGQRQRERDHAAREKAEGVKSRLSALAAAAALEAVALRSRIRRKQDASRRRLECHLQAIRERATGPQGHPARQSTSESQDQCSKEEREIQEEAERIEQERKERERQKAVKKRARKLKQKLLATSETPSTDYPTSIDPNPLTNKLYKVINQLNNILTPLLESNGNNDNGKKSNDKIDDFEEELERGGKKNKKGNKNGVDEGNERKKSKKRKGSEEKVVTNVTDSNNVDSNNANLTNSDDGKRKSKKNKNADVSKENQEEVEKTEIVVQTAQELPESAKTDTVKKKNKKNKNKDIENKNDRPKLSKTSSICSSLSDASKASCRSERRTNVDVDTTFMERQLNELNRMVEKFDKQGGTDKWQQQKQWCLAAAARALAIAEQDTGVLLSGRAVSTAVTVVNRVSAAGNAAKLLHSPASVHLARLLAMQLEKDLQSDQKEAELAKQMCDCLTMALESVLRSTVLYEDRKDKENKPGNEEVETLAALRSRAHSLISYICLCGVCSGAEVAGGAARAAAQALLAAAALLCRPCGVDAGSDRASASQSLRASLGQSICGARAEFCATVAEAEPAPARAAGTVRLLRAVAEMDHKIVQEAFGCDGWPLEFRAAAAQLLARHAPSDREPAKAQRTDADRLDQSLSEAMVLDLIALIGFVVVNNPQMQETICDNWSVIRTLCTVPANWLVSRAHSRALLPTLLTLTDRPQCAEAIASEVSVTMLEEYLESPEAQNVKLVQVIKQGRTKKTSSKK